MNTINLRGVRTLLVRAATVGVIAGATLTGSAAIASAQTQPTVPLTTCVLHTQNRGVVFSQLTYGDCFTLMYATPLNRPEHNAGHDSTRNEMHHSPKWVGGHSHSSGDQA